MKRMLINALDAEESRIAVVEDGVLQELHVEIANRVAYLGNIYKGKVVNIEPSIGAAFVNFGGNANGFLHVSDVLPAYGNEDFTLEGLVSGQARSSGEDGPDVLRSVLEDEEEADEESDSDQQPDNPSAEADAEPGAEADAEPDAESDAELQADADESGASHQVDVDEPWERTADSEPEPAAMAAAQAGEAEAMATAVSAPEQSAEQTAKEEVVVEPVKRARGNRGGRSARGGRGRGNAQSRVDNDLKPRERTTKIPIDQLLRKGQEVVVQVTKEGIGAKGPTLTTYVSLPGRYLVLMPSLPKCGVSRKIHDDKERRRLKRIVRALDETGEGGLGFIVRTAGVEKSKEDLVRDRDYLKKIWELVAKRLQVTRAPALLYQESDLVLKAMRDLFSPDIEDVTVDSKDVHLRIQDFTEKLMPSMADRIRRHESTTPIFHSFGIEGEVQNLYQPRVELPNGISIVIDQTEALVAIDVNSGRFKPGTNLEETAFKTNQSAIPEIARQLRLRDLGGVIIIDFIDMSLEKHKRSVERKLIDSMRGDKARIKVGRISPFGMMELTRQRVGPGLKRTVFNTCGHCHGAGLSRTVQSKALAVLRDVRAILSLKGFSLLQVYVAPPVNDYLANYKRRTLLDLEEAIGKSVVVKGEPSYPVDVVHYRFLTADGQEARVVIPAGLGVRL